jgi:hypothetical protein
MIVSGTIAKHKGTPVVKLDLSQTYSSTPVPRTVGVARCDKSTTSLFDSSIQSSYYKLLKRDGISSSSHKAQGKA